LVQDFTCPFWRFGKSYAYYETDIYAYRTTGLGVGSDIDRLQPVRYLHHSTRYYKRAGNALYEQVRHCFKENLGMSFHAGYGVLYPALSFFGVIRPAYAGLERTGGGSASIPHNKLALGFLALGA